MKLGGTGRWVLILDELVGWGETVTNVNCMHL